MNKNETQTMEVTTTPDAPAAVDVSLVPDIQAEFSSHQQRLVDWAEGRCQGLKMQLKELETALALATKNRWGTRKALFTQVSLLQKRIMYYGKMKAAFAAGYVMVPNMPMDLFAVRTDRSTPKEGRSYFRFDIKRHVQADPSLAVGEGEYKNPIPFQTESGGEETKSFYWATEFQDEIDFPMNMVKPHIMEATSRAMALKLFDQFGVLPGRNQTVSIKGDPIILGQLLDPRPTGYGPKKAVSFLIAWRINTSDL